MSTLVRTTRSVVHYRRDGGMSVYTNPRTYARTYKKSAETAEVFAALERVRGGEKLEAVAKSMHIAYAALVREIVAYAAAQAALAAEEEEAPAAPDRPPRRRFLDGHGPRDT